MDNTARSSHSGSQKRQRMHRAQMCCSDGEFKQLTVAADQAGLSLSSYMRMRCLNVSPPRSARRAPVEVHALVTVMNDNNRIGSNVNQCARVLNTSGRKSENLEDAVSEWRAMIRRIMQVLGKDL